MSTQHNDQFEEELQPMYVSALECYLKKFHHKDLVSIMLEPNKELHYSIEVPHIDLNDDIPEIANIIYASPIKMFPLFESAALLCMDELFETHDEKANMSKKKNTHIRIHGFNWQNSVGIAKYNLPRSSDVGILVEVKGTVIRTGMHKTLEFRREYKCTKCGATSIVEVELEQMYQFPKPPPCQNMKSDKRCENRNFKPVEGSAESKDYQEIKIQEHVHKLGMGSIPRSLLLILQDDLVDKCQAGDDLTVSGIVVRRWKPVKEEERCDMEVVLVANHIRVNNEQRFGISMTEELKDEFEQFWLQHESDPLQARNEILANICPGVHGMFLVKLAVGLTIIGGVARVDPTHGTRIRGESHMLMVGEPGTGKSQFLRYASKLGSRCVLTTGIGTTTAGLTVSAVKDQGGEWVLEAGALVLADGGVCCIDEFASIRERDRTAIHEAMEQQTLSVAKAGLICKLHTRTSVLAATNAKGKYDPEKSISMNTTLASPLLSRFDIVLVLLDDNNDEWDRNVSEFILKGHQGNGYESAWAMDKMQAYFSYIKATFHPILTPEAKRILGQYYCLQRKSDSKNAARTTIRLLESMIRVAQAHARLMFRKTVEVQDAIISVLLMEASVTTSPLFEFKNPLHSMFPENPDEEYLLLEGNVLNMLGLSDDVGSQPFYSRADYTSSKEFGDKGAKMEDGDWGDAGIWNDANRDDGMGGNDDFNANNDDEKGNVNGNGNANGHANGNENGKGKANGNGNAYTYNNGNMAKTTVHMNQPAQGGWGTGIKRGIEEEEGDDSQQSQDHSWMRVRPDEGRTPVKQAPIPVKQSPSNALSPIRKDPPKPQNFTNQNANLFGQSNSNPPNTTLKPNQLNFDDDDYTSNIQDELDQLENEYAQTTTGGIKSNSSQPNQTKPTTSIFDSPPPVVNSTPAPTNTPANKPPTQNKFKTDEEEDLDSLQVDDDDSSYSYSSKSSFAVPSNSMSNYFSKPNTTATPTTTNHTSTYTNPTTSQTASAASNKRKDADLEWDNFSFLDDQPPDQGKTNPTSNNDDDDMPISKLKKKRFVE